jgi:hypothetical protein
MNSVSEVQACSKGEFSLVLPPTSVHENGSLLKAADGKCFDGDKFRGCDGSKLLWE